MEYKYGSMKVWEYGSKDDICCIKNIFVEDKNSTFKLIIIHTPILSYLHSGIPIVVNRIGSENI